MKRRHISFLTSALAVAFLLAALFGPWPYVFYQLLRWVVTACALALAWQAFDRARADRQALVPFLLFMALAIIFNPVAPLYLHRSVWLALDGIGALAFIVGMFLMRTSSYRSMKG